jgi:hypothetical protein
MTPSSGAISDAKGVRWKSSSGTEHGHIVVNNSRTMGFGVKNSSSSRVISAITLKGTSGNSTIVFGPNTDSEASGINVDLGRISRPFQNIYANDIYMNGEKVATQSWVSANGGGGSSGPIAQIEDSNDPLFAKIYFEKDSY